MHSYGCVATFTQEAGVAALEGPQDQVDEMVAEYKKRRDFVVSALNAIDGVECPIPAGAFYAFPNVSGAGMNAKELQARFLEEAGVATVAGPSFGVHADQYIRFSYANSVENIREALRRIRELLS